MFAALPSVALAQGSLPPAVAHARIDRRIDALPAQALLALPASKLVDPYRQRAAHTLARFRRPGFFLYVLSMAGALLWLWRSGNSARLRDWLRRRVRTTAGVRFLYGTALGFSASVAGLPAGFIMYRILHNVGLVPQDALSWLGDQLVAAVLSALATGLLIAVIMWFVEKSRLWYLYTAGLLYVFAVVVAFVDPLVFAPLFNTFTPLPVNSPVYNKIEAVALKAGVGGAGVYVMNLSKQSVAANAYVAGVGPTKRIVVADTLLRNSTPGEVAFVVAHELGHFVKRDILHGVFVGWLLLVLTAAVTILIADRIGFRTDDDPLARLALVGSLLLVTALVLLFPLYNTYSRGVEARADSFALALTGDRVAGVRLFVRFADVGMSLVCPSKPVRLYFYDHPPLGSRIAAVRGQPDPCP